MTTNETTMETTEAPANDDLDADVTDLRGGPKELREALKRANEDRDKYKAQAMTTAYAEVGLDPDKGLGKAIAEMYDGEPTAEALAEFAAEYGHEAPEVENPAQPAIDAGNQRLDDAHQASQSDEPKTQHEQAREAAAGGDLRTAGNIKADLLRKKFQ